MRIFQSIGLSHVPPAKAGTPNGQREFARRVTAAQGASLAELDALFATLQHRAFRGDLFGGPIRLPHICAD